MTASRQSRDAIGFLTEGPVLQTLAGARARVSLLSVGELMLLTAHYGCEVDELHRRLHRPPRRRRGRKGPSDGRAV